MIDDVVKTSEQIGARLEQLSGPMDIEGKRAQAAELEAMTAEEGFWDDPSSAQEKMQRLNAIKESIAPWQAVRKRLEDVGTLLELAQLEDDPEAYEAEASAELAGVTQTLDKLEIDTLLSGPHDAAPALLEINAGAGGDEANDWASMLLRMYLRWAESNGYKVEIVDEVEGDVAGIKSSTLRIEGKSAYGLLQGERGVHRLVRLSPFNANNKRQTSFASVDVVPEVAEVGEVEIPDKDIRRDVYRASGAGGQHVNKTSSAVRLTHLPTGIVVSCQNERSQTQNEAFATKVLKAKLLELARQENKASIDELRGERRGIEFGSQIRNYVFQPYTLVKDVRTGHETGDILRVMNGEFDDFIDAYLRWQHAQRHQVED
ncbi:MAG: peptide chain release factor 2 [Capsulimonas sp.]|uniref:peptide chain release factor 2 n=1 Tax=Capsulimonas sp. TaxID=2494211 RepID=UPI003265CBCF|nr:peptide chain release factor 2 [Capsulimonas sp.]